MVGEAGEQNKHSQCRLNQHSLGRYRKLLLVQSERHVYPFSFYTSHVLGRINVPLQLSRLGVLIHIFFYIYSYFH